jgi:hypothetical protein
MSLQAGEYPTTDSLLQLSIIRLAVISHQPSILLLTNCSSQLVRLITSWHGLHKNVAPHCSSSIISMGTSLFVKVVLSACSCIFAYLMVVAQQSVTKENNKH